MNHNIIDSEHYIINSGDSSAISWGSHDSSKTFVHFKAGAQNYYKTLIKTFSTYSIRFSLSIKYIICRNTLLIFMCTKYYLP